MLLTKWKTAPSLFPKSSRDLTSLDKQSGSPKEIRKEYVRDRDCISSRKTRDGEEVRDRFGQIRKEEEKSHGLRRLLFFLAQCFYAPIT
ncbi:hypothetical protein TNCT_64841 [Trichonephila clavata]|uniref:Uncharacterized protein n=1 Tax=Trichonephila clavata TaxID=2740835 RepID=A0A8X6G8X5_TRICU|nr:hypothetical protein TNCT_64841 [Trichonephila clavata]